MAPGPSTGTRARARPLTEAARRFTAEQFTQAERFLAWLDQHDRRLGDCAQADLDAWCAQAAEHHKRAARMFLTWAITTHHMPNLALPTLNIRTGERLTQTRRLALLRRVLTDDGPPTPARATAALILVYAQPATRIVRLTIDDILDLGDQMLIRLGEPPSPVPDPLANILRHLRHLVAGVPARPALPSPPVDGCFLAPGQPTHPRHLLDLVRGLGIPAQATRVAVVRQLVVQAPAPVIADALGYHAKQVAKVWAEAGGTWKTYAPATTAIERAQSPGQDNRLLGQRSRPASTADKRTRTVMCAPTAGAHYRRQIRAADLGRSLLRTRASQCTAGHGWCRGSGHGTR